jgi:hypothetical protein
MKYFFTELIVQLTLVYYSSLVALIMCNIYKILLLIYKDALVGNLTNVSVCGVFFAQETSCYHRMRQKRMTVHIQPWSRLKQWLLNQYMQGEKK